MKRKLLALILAAALMLCAAVPALAAAPTIRKTDYEGKGVVEVEFNSNKVQYKNLKVTVRDADGKACKVRILEKDNDDLSFKVISVKPGMQYTFTVKGVRDGSRGSFGRVKGSFRTPSDAPEIQNVEYDADDRELEIEFATPVQFRKPKVVVKNADGRKLAVSNLKKGRDDIEVRVKGLKPNATYTVTVSGVRVKGVGTYTKVTKTFTIG